MDILRRINSLVTLLLLAWFGMALYQAGRALPDQLSLSLPWRPAQNLQWLSDQTWQTASGERLSRQQIFDQVLEIIDQARRLVVLDMFLFNEFAGQHGYRPLSSELAGALIRARENHPDLEVVLITDPFNTLYGGVRNPHLDALQAAGITVVTTPLERLPASNPLWTGLWALCCQFLGNSTEGGWLPNPVGPGKVTLRSYLHLINFRANHRKTLIADAGDGWTALVTSGNPHDASSRHSNQALRFDGPAALDLLYSEQAVTRMASLDTRHWPTPPAEEPVTGPRLRILTEGAIKRALLETVNDARPGDRLDLEVFYLSHRPLLKALISARQRGVELRVLLDPNRDAFGREKNGIPNRQAAWDLHRAGIPVRWCNTSGEQCHRKWLRLDRADGSSELISGSANFTRRNLDDLNLETDVQLHAHRDYHPMAQAREEFERLWSNAEGVSYSLDYEAFADHSQLRYGLYRVMEASGLSTF
ncbi:phospholipase D-like domain-containing protein [Halopseudomonas sp. Lyrl_26]|uniref:phospholipase D-like domain-containing protein n=1 Tax=Halopseudomonas sp. Lyrl_26 TaxID=3110923 RepID=UPI003F7D83B8